MAKKADLAPDTVDILKRILAMPPKHHDDMKVGRPKSKKKRDPKGRASSAKQRNA